MAPKARAFLDKADPTTRQILAPLFQRVENLETSAAAAGTLSSPLSADLDVGGNKITNAAVAIADTDIPTFAQVKQYIDAVFKSKGL